MTKAIGKEYAETGITCNALAPAVVRTAMVDAMPAEQVKYMTGEHVTHSSSTAVVFIHGRPIRYSCNPCHHPLLGPAISFSYLQTRSP